MTIDEATHAATASSGSRVTIDDIKAWRLAGWQGVLPIPFGKKGPPPGGFTGAENAGSYPSQGQLIAWQRNGRFGNLAIRLPKNVIGIDVDGYDHKRGAQTLARLEALLGPLPRTVWSTSRADLVSGIRLYRLPDGVDSATFGDVGEDIETIRHEHRYMLTWPSLHADTGAPYRLIAPDGEILERVPSADELPELPIAWCDHLASKQLQRPDGPMQPRQPTATSAPKRNVAPARPGESASDLINRFAEWEELLVADGWSVAGRRPSELIFSRPGVIGHNSARCGYSPDDRLRVISSDGGIAALHTVGFPLKSIPGSSISKLDYLSVIRFGGDVSEASRWIQQTYGRPSTPPPPPSSKKKPTPKSANDDEWEAGDADEASIDPDTLTERDEQWDEPIAPPRAGNTAALAEFPLDALPAWISAHVAATAAATQSVPDLGAMMALGALSSLTTGRADVICSIPRGPMPTQLYLMTASPSGTSKTGVKDAMTGVIQKFQSELAERHLDQSVNAKLDLEAAEIEHKQLKDQWSACIAELGRHDPLTVEAQKKLVELEAELQKLRKALQVTPRLTVADITPEGLAAVLDEQGGRVTLLDDEASVIDILTGTYTGGRTPNVGPYLHGWNRGMLDIRRKGSAGMPPTDIQIRIDLTVCVGVQYSQLEKLATRPELRSRGVVPRFMMAMPPDIRGTRDRRRSILGSDDLYEEVVAAAEYDRRMLDVAQRFYDLAEPDVFLFAPDALTVYADWLGELEERTATDPMWRDMAEWVAKLEGSVGRLAALLHIADGKEADELVELSTLLRAIQIGDYWISHQLAITAHLTSSATTKAAERNLTLRFGDVIAAAMKDRYDMRLSPPELRAMIDKHAGNAKAGHDHPLVALADYGWIRFHDLTGRPVTARVALSSTTTATVHPRFVELWQATLLPPEDDEAPQMPSVVVDRRAMVPSTATTLRIATWYQQQGFNVSAGGSVGVYAPERWDTTPMDDYVPPVEADTDAVGMAVEFDDPEPEPDEFDIFAGEAFEDPGELEELPSLDELLAAAVDAIPVDPEYDPFSGGG